MTKVQSLSIQSKIDSFTPTFLAQTGGKISAPVFTNCQFGSLTIDATIKDGAIDKHNDDGLEVPPHDSESKRARNPHCSSLVEECQKKLKARFKRHLSHLNESLCGTTDRTALNEIYTELFITEGESCDVNKVHEIRQIEATSRQVHLEPEKSIHCSDVFKDSQTRTVVTRGVAGIGKTVLVHKFTLDWAEERANLHLKFVIPLCFRELNLLRQEYSFVDMISRIFPETEGSGIFTTTDICKVLIILDGLDESCHPLDFENGEIVSDVTQPSTVALILVNLIRRKMLPEARLWITTRPAAFSQVQEESIDLVTEVRGFTDEQKEKYFHRKIADTDLAKKIVAHVKSNRSLHVMCHIPIFCLMAANVLKDKLTTARGKDTPTTLTQMYIHFLSVYIKGAKKRLFQRRASISESLREHLITLGKLAFEGLKSGQLIFYEQDLSRNRIKVTQASALSGLYSQIFNEKTVLLGEKTYCFVHLSIQEFFAALYVFLTFHNENNNVLVKKSSITRRLLSRDTSEAILYKEAVEKALHCEDGRFDLFLRFLLGFSLEANLALLKPLMTHNRSKPKTRAQVIKHIKERIQSSPSPDRSLNLFYGLNEMNDQSLEEEIKSFIRAGSLSRASLSPAQWTSLVFVLLTSAKELSMFVLKEYSRSEEGLLKLLPVVKTAQVAKLDGCHLTARCCEPLANIMGTSKLRELDLSDNMLTDEGFKRLCAGMKNSRLQTLRLRSCDLSEVSADDLAELLCTESLQLKVLDLGDNNLQDSGVRKLSVGLRSPRCKLEVLVLCLCRVTEEGCTFLEYALSSACLKELDLSYNHPGESGVRLLSTLCADPSCALEKFSFDECDESRIHPGPKIYATKLSLDPDTAHPDISLTGGYRKASRGVTQPYPDSPKRFEFYAQVLCKEGLTGRCYWEVKWCGRVLIAVAYRKMSRKGEGHDAWLGQNNDSWALSCHESGFKTFHNGAIADLGVKPESDKIGVFLDWHAGTLSFFAVCGDTLTLLANLNANFTEPVYPGFRLGWVDSTVQLC
ncbi:NACHT, LRR and PYD domains-containing protein 3-like [Neosynchiropus ocellatus]